jgi:hypothetical protein
MVAVTHFTKIGQFVTIILKFVIDSGHTQLANGIGDKKSTAFGKL